mgnify:CR=1 FL=1
MGKADRRNQRLKKVYEDRSSGAQLLSDFEASQERYRKRAAVFSNIMQSIFTLTLKKEKVFSEGENKVKES